MQRLADDASRPRTGRREVLGNRNVRRFLAGFAATNTGTGCHECPFIGTGVE